MCVLSMVLDHYQERWAEKVALPQPSLTPALTPDEIEDLRRLIARARQYDREHNQPDCELDEKRQTLKRLAKQLGVEIAFL